MYRSRIQQDYNRICSASDDVESGERGAIVKRYVYTSSSCLSRDSCTTIRAIIALLRDSGNGCTATGANFVRATSLVSRTPLFARARVSEVTRTESGAILNYILVSSLSLFPPSSPLCRVSSVYDAWAIPLVCFSSSSTRSLASVQLSVEERWRVTEEKGSGKKRRRREKVRRWSERKAEKCVG